MCLPPRLAPRTILNVPSSSRIRNIPAAAAASMVAAGSERSRSGSPRGAAPAEPARTPRLRFSATFEGAFGSRHSLSAVAVDDASAAATERTQSDSMRSSLLIFLFFLPWHCFYCIFFTAAAPLHFPHMHPSMFFAVTSVTSVTPLKIFSYSVTRQIG
jgi:hypothetical protein